MDNADARMGNIYDQQTTVSYYEVQGSDVEGHVKTEPDKLLENMIPASLKDKTVLDLGSGNGRYSEVLAKKGAKRVIALDLSESMVDETRARKETKGLDNLEIIKADIEELPIGDEKIDYVFSRFALMYTDELAATVQRLSSALSADGEMLFEVNAVTIKDKQHLSALKKEPVSLILSLGGKSVNIKNFAHTLDEYKRAFKDAGLTISSLEQFPAEDLAVDPDSPYAEELQFNYVVFKAVKERE